MIWKNNCKLLPELRMLSLFLQSPRGAKALPAPLPSSRLSQNCKFTQALQASLMKKINSALSAWMDGWICTMVI